MVVGDWIGGFVLIELQVGLDVLNLKMWVWCDGDYYVIDGVKQFIILGKNGDVIIVFVVIDFDVGKKGILVFIVLMDMFGYQVVCIEDKLGLYVLDICVLVFVEMCVLVENLLGIEGEGYCIVLVNLEGGCIGIVVQVVGMVCVVYEVVLVYVCDWLVFGKFLIEYQVVVFKLVDMVMQIDVVWFLVWCVVMLCDVGKFCLIEVSMVKLFVLEIVEKVVFDVIQIYGGYGYLVDYLVEWIYCDICICQIYEGISEVQCMVIVCGF